VQQADEEAKALYEGRQAETQADQQKVIDLLRGKPAITLPQDQQGPVAPEQPADIKSAFATAAQSRNPALQNFGMQGILTQAETQAKLAQQNTLRQQNAALWKSVNGDAQAFLQAGGDPTIAKEFAESKGWGKGKIKNADGTLYNEDTGEILKTLSNPNKPFNADGTPNQAYIDYELKKAQSGAPNVSVNTGQKGFDNTLKLRSDFRSEPVYIAHQAMSAAHAQIGAGLKAGTPVGDLAAATKIMKLLDPSSVVRESELGMAIAASGLADRISNYASNIINGTKLTPQQRTDFQALADQLFSESVNQYNAKRSEYGQIAQRNQLPEADVIGNPAKFSNIVSVPTQKPLTNRPPLTSFNRGNAR
jgi:hypothetical protein